MKSLATPPFWTAPPFRFLTRKVRGSARKTRFYVVLGQAWTKSAGSSGAGGFGIALGVPI